MWWIYNCMNYVCCDDVREGCTMDDPMFEWHLVETVKTKEEMENFMKENPTKCWGSEMRYGKIYCDIEEFFAVESNTDPFSPFSIEDFDFMNYIASNIKQAKHDAEKQRDYYK